MSDFRRLLIERGIPFREAPPLPTFRGPAVVLALRRAGPMADPISFVRRLRAAGVTVPIGKSVLDELCEVGAARAEVNEGAGIEALVADLAGMEVAAEPVTGRAMPCEDYKALRAKYRAMQPEPFDRRWLTPTLIFAALAPLLFWDAIVVFAVLTGR